MGYIAIRTPDQATRDMLTYARLLIKEARKHSGEGWKAYDTVFQENAAIAPLTDWTKIESSLHATSFIANRSGDSVFCSESDHTSDDCAVSIVKQGPAKKSPDAPHKVSPARAEENHSGKWPLKGKGPLSQHLIPYSAPYTGTPGHICHSWNYTKCIFPNRCRLEHICAISFTKGGLHREHPARECTATPQGGERQTPVHPPGGVETLA